jgi:phenylalanyl-tRNA synthetase beta chain
VDLIEEVSRVVGMDVVPSRLQARFAPESATDRTYDRAMALRRAFVAAGLHEARGLTLVPNQPLGLAAAQVDSANLLRLKNPMIDDQVVLRPSLLHGLFKAVGDNFRAGAKSVRLFEIGRVYSCQQPEEFPRAAIVLSGPIAPRNWRAGAGREGDLFDLKGMLTAAFGAETTFEPQENPALALSLLVEVAGRPIGCAGELWPAEARALEAAGPVVFAEIDLGAIETRGSARRYREIPRFPSTTRDIALVASLKLTHAEITSTLAAAHEPLLECVELFDVFSDPAGERVPPGKKSLAYSLTYRASDRTLTADEVNAAHARLKERLKTSLGVALRE